MKRAKDTANLISDKFMHSEKELIFKQDPRLREKSSGIYEGYPIGTTFFMAKEAGIDNRVYKAPGGENWLEVNERLKSFLSHMVEQSSTNTRVMKVLCVTHGSLILEIQNILSGYLDDSVSYNTRPKAKIGSFYIYEIK